MKLSDEQLKYFMEKYTHPTATIAAELLQLREQLRAAVRLAIEIEGYAIHSRMQCPVADGYGNECGCGLSTLRETLAKIEEMETSAR
jgi:hypothetical protein